MNLLLNRTWFTDHSTIGLLSIDGTYECYILEDKDRFLENPGAVKVYGQSAIPIGRYKIVFQWSGHFQRQVPWLLNVPQFTDIEIHPGNSPADTKGCLCPGQEKGIDRVYRSVLAFDALMDKLNKATDDIWIEIKRKG